MADDKTALIVRLADIARFESEHHESGGEVYYVTNDLPSNDFNREIVAPGCHEDYPEGCVRIMCDDDFWEVAVLPPEYAAVGCSEIVEALWPRLETPVIRPDSGDYWWTAIHDDSLEVPSFPYELWLFVYRQGEVSERLRVDVFTEEAEAEAKGNRLKVSTSDDSVAMWQVRRWGDGVRIDGEEKPLRSTTSSTGD